jgi:hypothetical protein
MSRLAKRLMTITLSLGSVLGALSGVATGTPFLDQSSVVGNETLLVGLGDASSDWQQEITAGADGFLSSVSLRIIGPGSLIFYLNLGPAWQSDANNFETEVSVPYSGWFSVDVSSANFQVAPGTHYVIGARTLLSSDNRPYLVGAGGNPYPGGSVWGALPDGSVLELSGALDFQTYLIPIPEPSAFALSLAAIVCAAIWSLTLGESSKKSSWRP